jgi:hypothetical protein
VFKKGGVATSLPTGTVGPNAMVPEVVIGAPAIAWRSTVLALQGAVPPVDFQVLWLVLTIILDDMDGNPIRKHVLATCFGHVT